MRMKMPVILELAAYGINGSRIEASYDHKNQIVRVRRRRHNPDELDE